MGEVSGKAADESTKEAKREVSGKATDESMSSMSPVAKSPETKKRGRPSKPAEKPTNGEAQDVKKPRGRPAKPTLPENIVAACKAATKAGEPSMEGMLIKLLDSDQFAEKGLTPEQGLNALKASGGLLNKARAAL